MTSTPAYNWDESTRTYLTGRFTLGIFIVILFVAIIVRYFIFEVFRIPETKFGFQIAFCVHVRMDFIREKKRRSGKVCMIPSGPKKSEV
ncbi:hypothetical protein B9Z55_002955 [Caenorhabditis nigoni]|uniref:Uncharacterized protein n=1 Tax=Caenorhabditis nigoni TaxID=1611254 RepID=A0A2G5VMT3_9PELO|nr:hypothetical protein B9Z55_002955 [Caenorhabditis nigoni]